MIRSFIRNVLFLPENPLNLPSNLAKLYRDGDFQKISTEEILITHTYNYKKYQSFFIK